MQVATFPLPANQAEANEFLKTIDPMEVYVFGSFFSKTLFVKYDNGQVSPREKMNLLTSRKKGILETRFQLEVALTTTTAELKYIAEEIPRLDKVCQETPTNQPEWDRAHAMRGALRHAEGELHKAIKDLEIKIMLEGVKLQGVEGRIADL